MTWAPAWSPAADAAARTRDGIDTWVRSEPLWQLVAAWGVARPATSDTGELLDWLDEFSAEHWDFRGGRERNLATAARLTQRQASAAIEFTPLLGLAPSLPSVRAYDAVVMTGGMVRAGLVKPRFVRGLLDAGVSADRVVFLGAHRAFAGDEARLAAALGVRADDEFDAMAAGLERAFELRDPQRVSAGEGHARASTLRWAHPSSPRFEVVAAPSGVPAERRADTADTLRYWADSLDATIRSVLIVTTPIYVPYQAAVAVETLGLGRGMAVETVGVDAAANDLGEHTQRFEPQHHLQELRSAVRGLRSLHGHSILRSPRM